MEPILSWPGSRTYFIVAIYAAVMIGRRLLLHQEATRRQAGLPARGPPAWHVAGRGLHGGFLGVGTSSMLSSARLMAFSQGVPGLFWFSRAERRRASGPSRSSPSVMRKQHAMTIDVCPNYIRSRFSGHSQAHIWAIVLQVDPLQDCTAAHADAHRCYRGRSLTVPA